jgi:hypothetical protein
MWAAGELAAGEWSTARDQLSASEQALQVELTERAAPPDIERIRSARGAWAVLNLDERRQLLAIFTERIVIHPATPGAKRFDPDRVEIVWRTA